jgi:hypothetical protein
MRVLGAALLAAGVGVALLWPSLLARHSGDVKARLTVFDRAEGGWERGWKSAQVDLSPADNPVRIVVEAEFLPGSRRLQSTTGLLAVVARSGAIVGEENLELPLPGRSGSDRQPRIASAISAPFAVTQAAAHTISIRSTAGEDMDFSRAVAVIRTGGNHSADRWRIPGFVAIAAGLLLLAIAGRKRRRRRR